MDRRAGNKIFRSQLLHAQNTQRFINKEHNVYSVMSQATNV